MEGLMPKINLGTDICFAAKFWPEPEKWIDIVKNILGLNIIEFDTDFLDPLYHKKDKYLKIAKEIGELCKESAIDIHNVFSGSMTHYNNFLTHPDKRLRESGMRWCKGAVDIARKIGARGLGSHFNTIPYYVIEDKQRYEEMCNELFDSIIKISNYSQRKGMKFLLWEQMYAPSEIPYRVEQTNHFFQKINARTQLPIKLALDVGHSCCYNFEHSDEDTDPYKWIEKCGHLAEIIHIHQTKKFTSDHLAFTKENNKIGIVHPEKVMEALDKSGVEEIYLILEIFYSIETDINTILREMEESVKYWDSYIKQYNKANNSVKKN